MTKTSNPSPTLAAGRDGLTMSRLTPLAEVVGRWLERSSRRELTLFATAYVAYTAARWVFTGDVSQAQAHAQWVMAREREFGLAIEASVQHMVGAGLLTWFLSNVYLAAQLVVLPVSLVWLYRGHRQVYRALRNTILATWLIAVPIYAIFPVAPPRLADAGIVDTVSEQAGFALTGHSTLFYNPLAAVPSLHVGFAFAIGIASAGVVRAPWARALTLAWGPLVSLAVVATGNHYLFDIAAGLIVTAVGYVTTRPIGRRPPSRCDARRRRSGRMTARVLSGSSARAGTARQR